ncbi:MAG TPA: glycosyltransferase [Gaiellaceae bacterium]|nr:glycosyltransferase [Gaiellaceae bacterium]
MPPPRRPLSAAPALLYVNANLWFGVRAGGSVGHVAGVVNALLRRGLEVDVAAVAPQPMVHESAGFIPLTPPAGFATPEELNHYRFSRSAAAQLRKHIDPNRHRFIYQRLSLGNYTGAKLANDARLPLVLEYNGSEVWVARHWARPVADEPLATAAENASLHAADVVVAVSRVLEQELLDRGVESRRIVMHPNGVDTALFDPKRLRESGAAVRRALALAPTATVVTFLGTFGNWHGTEILAHAIRLLAETEPDLVSRRDVHFLLVGDGLKMPRVRDILANVLPQRIHLPGLVPQGEAPAFLAASDIVVSPHVPNDDGSPFFGSPTKLFEYMAMELPIVASELDQIGDVLRAGVRVIDLPRHDSLNDATALLTKPGDVEELAAGIRALVDNSGWRAALGTNARRLAVARYTWDAHVDAILDRLEDVCG